MAKTKGEAAPKKPAMVEEDVSDDIMTAAASKLGVNLDFKPESGGEAEASTEAPEAEEAGEAEDGETAEADSTETAEEKTTRETAEAAAREESPEAKAAREAEAEETDEEKDAREAEEAAAAETPEAKDAAALAAETKKFVNLRLKDLPELTRKRVEAAIGARIGPVIGKSRAEQARLEARVEELTDEVEEAKKSATAPVNIPGVHPLELVATSAELDTRLEQIDAFEEFAADNPDGTEGDPAKGIPPWTPEQIRGKMRELKRERDRVIPAVRAKLQARASIDADLKKSYPALFDRKSEDYRSAQALLKQMPELRRHANANVLIAQLIQGAKALADKAKLPAAGSKPAATEPRKAPRVPGAGSSGRGSPISTPAGAGKTNAAAAITRLNQNPGDRGAYNEAVMATVGELETL